MLVLSFQASSVWLWSLRLTIYHLTCEADMSYFLEPHSSKSQNISVTFLLCPCEVSTGNACSECLVLQMEMTKEDLVHQRESWILMVIPSGKANKWDSLYRWHWLGSTKLNSPVKTKYTIWKDLFWVKKHVGNVYQDLIKRSQYWKYFSTPT